MLYIFDFVSIKEIFVRCFFIESEILIIIICKGEYFIDF